jgi:hypothetical protein
MLQSLGQKANGKSESKSSGRPYLLGEMGVQAWL